MTLLVLLFLPLLVSLGLWQLSRAEEKERLLLSYRQLQLEQPVNLDALTEQQSIDYLPVYLQGKFDSARYWLLDNRSRNGHTGYEVVAPLITDQHLVLVNIGWVRSSPERNRLPIIDLPAGSIRVVGHLYTPQKNALMSTGESDLPMDWPKRVLQIDWNVVARQLGFSNSDFSHNGRMLATKTVRIDAEDPVALVTDWSPVNINPAKHKAYAFQWFAMTVALLILYGWFLYSESRMSNNEQDKKL